jgi:toxin ParE1/3/4
MSARSRPVRLSPDAQRDYDDILLYGFLTWGETQVQHYRSALDRGLVAIGDYPEIGRSHDRLLPGCRSLQVEHHEIYDRINPDEIEVVRILHERADAARHLGTRQP